MLVVSALGHGAAASPRWDRLARAARTRPAAEWALPLAAVDAVLLAFGVLQAAVLFGGYTPSLSAAGVTYSERAHQGFGQLVVVTLLTLALLGWAGRRADPRAARHRAVLAITGGLLVVLALGVVASALRRLWLYEQAYGWTVLRLCVAGFELWLAVVLVLVGAAWAARRTALVPRGVAVSAAAALLVLALAGPDALVARWNVDRLRHTGTLDVAYLSALSADAVPELVCLPEPYRTQVLAGRRVERSPWYAANLARFRARAALGRPANCG